MAATVYGSLAVANKVSGIVTSIDKLKSTSLQAIQLGGGVIEKLQLRYEDDEPMKEAKIAPLQAQLAGLKVQLQAELDAIEVPSVAELQALAETEAP